MGVFVFIQTAYTINICVFVLMDLYEYIYKEICVDDYFETKKNKYKLLYHSTNKQVCTL